MQCIVYKSTRRADAYVYVLEEKALEKLPPALTASMAPFTEVLRFELTAERKLARVDATVVRRNLEEIGYHVQFPPAEYESIGDPRNLGPR